MELGRTINRAMQLARTDRAFRQSGIICVGISVLLLSSLTAPIVGNVFEVVTNIVVPTQVCFTTPGGWYDSNGQAYYTYPATECYNIDVVVTSIQYVLGGFFDILFGWVGAWAAGCNSDFFHTEIIVSAFILLAGAATAAALSHTSASSAYCGTHTSPVGLLSILTNNLRLASILALGGFLLGAPTVVELALNGFVLGNTVSQLQAVPMVFVAGVLPHGVLELAGEIVAGSIGLRFARTELNLIRNRDAEMSMKPIAVNAGVAILLVSVAASIEALVTPALLSGLCR